MSSWNEEEKASAEETVRREMARREKAGEVFMVLQAPSGQKKLCRSFWAQSWCRHLESFEEYQHRLQRGRSYLRKGHVFNLKVDPGVITATVRGGSLYDVRIPIQPLESEQWQGILQKALGQVGSMLDLLAGKMGDDLLRALTAPHEGLLPAPREIRFDCNCPDYADLCKHAAAVLYGVGVLLDDQPELLFRLRQVDQAELLTHASQSALNELTTSTAELADEDLAALFGIDFSSESPHPPRS